MTGASVEGWQVEFLDLESLKIYQVSDGIGDKYTPQYSVTRDQIVARDSRGKIVSYSSGGGKEFLVTVPHCSDFSILPESGNSLLTRLVSGNTQRQQVWEAKAPFPTEELRRVTAIASGTLRQPHTSKGNVLISYTSRQREEQIVLLKKTDQQFISQFEPLSPEFTFSAYPTWLSQEDWMCSHQVSDQNYDLYQQKGGEFIPLLETEEYSEFASTYNPETNTVYYERVSKNGKWSLAGYELENSVITSFQYENEAKSPFFVNLPEHWFDESN